MIDNKYTHISLFSGCGGSSLGFHQAGDYLEVLAVEIEKHAVMSFNLNFPNVPITNLMEFRAEIPNYEPIGIRNELTGQGVLDWANNWFPLFNDEKKINIKLGELDVLAASSPCQDFSMANTDREEKIDDEKNNLFLETIRLIKEINPKVAVIENVPGMMKGKNHLRFFLFKIMKAFSKINYKVRFKILNSARYGVPQSRDRLIFLCVRKDVAQTILGRENFDSSWWPDEPDPLPKVEELCLQKIVSHVAYFSSEQFNKDLISSTEIINTITKTPSTKFYDDKYNKIDPTIENIKKLCGFPLEFRLYDVHGGELDPSTGKFYINPEKELEYSYTQKYNRLGNAVMPPLMKAIATSIKEKILAPYYEKIKS